MKRILFIILLALLELNFLPVDAAQDGWLQIGGPAKIAVSGEDHGVEKIYATNPDTKQIYEYKGTPLIWEKVGVETTADELVMVGTSLYLLCGPRYDVMTFDAERKQIVHITRDETYAAHIYGGENGVYMIDKFTSEIYEYRSVLDWEKTGGPGSSFAVGESLYGLSPDRSSVWQYTGTPLQWTKIGGPAFSIYAGGRKLWATNPDTNDIYEYKGTPMAWEKVGGPAKKFVVVGETLYGLSPDGSSIWKYTGTPLQWTQVGGPAGTIFGGSSLLATNPQTHDLWMYKEKRPKVEIKAIDYVRPPDTIAVNEATLVKTNILYTDLAAGTKAEAIVRDASGIVGSGLSGPLSDSGEYTFSTVITPTKPGAWSLEVAVSTVSGTLPLGDKESIIITVVPP